MNRIKGCIAGAVAGMALGTVAEEPVVNVQELEALQNEMSVLKTRLTEQQEKLLQPVRFQLPDGMTFGVLVEIEAAYRSTSSEDESDFTLATVELSGGWQLMDWLRADAVFLYEEDDTEPMDVDQAVLTLGNTEQFPLFLQAGKMYVPFGHFDSFFISDPIVVELAETRETGVLTGFEKNGFAVSAAAFNGDVETDGENQADNLVLSASYGFERKGFSLETGAGWIRNIMDADSLTGVLENSYSYTYTADDTGGFNAWATVVWGSATLIAEYVTVLDEIEVNGIGTGFRPDSLNLELGYAINDRFDAAVKYEQSTEVSDWFAEKRYGAGCRCLLAETDLCSTGIALEYMKEEYGVGAEDVHVVTAQLTVEF